MYIWHATSSRNLIIYSKPREVKAGHPSTIILLQQWCAVFHLPADTTSMAGDAEESSGQKICVTPVAGDS